MDDEPHVGLVDTHAESDRGDDHVGALHQEIVLILGARGRIHARMIGQRLDAVGHQQLGQFLDLLAAQTIDDAAAPLLLLDEADDVAVHVVLGTDFVIEIRTVERRFENRGVVHAEVLLMSSCTFGVAVAVRAISGAVPISLMIGRMRRYSGRKSWPHSEMQCASSMA